MSLALRSTRLLAMALAVQALPSAAVAQSPLRASLEAMHLSLDSARLAILYVPGNEARVAQIRALLEPMLTFYKEKLGVTVHPAVALLDSAHWADMRGGLAPFPVPFITDAPNVAVVAIDPLPAAEMNALRPLSISPPMPADAAASVRALHRDPTHLIDLVLLARDALAAHEVGHSFTAAYGIATPRRWMSEFLANYWEEAYLAEAYPALTQFGRQLERGMQGPPKPVTYTTLAELDQHGGPPGMPVLNYEWYQAALTARAREVFALRGTAFLTDMRGAFPRSETARLSDEEVLKRLDAISPGWTAWVANFGADRR